MEKYNKRIVFVIGSMRRAGAERVISILANRYVESGWEVDILTLLDKKNDYILDKKIRVISLCKLDKSRIKQLPYWIKSIRRYVINNNPDRIVSFIARINIITIIACFGLDKSIIVSERNDPKNDGRSIIVKAMTNLLYPYCKSVVFQTKWAKECFSKRVQKKGVIIPNPINISTKATGDMIRKKIVSVGRLSEQKNHKLLIMAFSKVKEIFPEYKLYIYGEGNLRNELEELIKKLGLNESVFLEGNQLNIHERIADAEMFVLSSDYEGLSNALLEAMIMGIPCISTDCAGSTEFIKNGINGILVNKKNVDDLSSAIINLIRDKSLSQKIKKNGVLLSEKLDSKTVFREWERIIGGNNEKAQ